VESDLARQVRAAIRDVPDFPKPGILFRDVTTLLLRPDLLAGAVHELWVPFEGKGITHVVGVEARGFIVATGLSILYRLPLVLMRKPGKLPARRIMEEYDLEYGRAALEVHEDALHSGDCVLVADDVLATGGTAAAAGRLVQRCGAEVVGYCFLAELRFLNGREPLSGAPIVSLVSYELEDSSQS
jgi:adenine phosphoribosyltransferase